MPAEFGTVIAGTAFSKLKVHWRKREPFVVLQSIVTKMFLYPIFIRQFKNKQGEF